MLLYHLPFANQDQIWHANGYIAYTPDFIWIG